jgi:hypothetical protein
MGMLILVGLGAWGSWLYQHGFAVQKAPAFGIFDALYASMRLFALEGPTDLDKFGWNWWLLPIHLARFCAPLLLAGGAATLGWRYLQASRERRAIGKLRDHIVICVGSTKERDPAHRLAIEYVERREQGAVLCLVKDAASDGAERLREKGALILQGESSRPETLRDGRAGEASRVIIDLGSEVINARAVRALARVLQARTKEAPVHCHVASNKGRVENEWDRGIIGRAGGKLVLHPFSVPRAAARRLFDLHPPWESRLPQDRGATPLHVLVVGFGPQAQAIVLQTVRSCHFADQQNVRITVVAPGTKGDRAGLDWCQTHMPAWQMVADIEFHTRAPETVTAEEWTEWQKQWGPYDHIYVAVEDMGGQGAGGLGLANTLSGRISQDACTIVVYEEGVDDARIFPVWAEAVTLEAIISEQQDRMAQHIHQYYSDKYGDTRTWEVLTTDDRDSNRDQADHIWAKLGMIEAFTRQKLGAAHPDYPSVSELASAQHAISKTREADESTSDTDEAAQATPLSMLRELSECVALKGRLKKPSEDRPNPDYDEALVELLARVEHRRWMASRICAGWTYGAPRNNKAKHHPLIVAYDTLDEIEREKDRDTARNLPALLKLALEAMSNG